MTGRAVARIVALAAALAVARAASARLRLTCTAETHAGAPPRLDLVAVNAGDEAVREVHPEVVYQRRVYPGEPVALAPGARHAWRIELAAPPGPGTFTATVRVHYLDPSARPRSVPVVTAVSTPEAPASPLGLTLEARPVAGAGGATLLVENPGERPIAGRVVIILAGGLGTDPESMPVQVGARDRTSVPLVLENRGRLPPGSYPAYALFEYTESAEHRLALAHTDLEVVEDGGGARTRPLLVGAGALVLMLALLAVAWRRTAART